MGRERGRDAGRAPSLLLRRGFQKMDRAELAERLAKARQAVAQGDEEIHNQRDLIARLTREGKDTSGARTVLDALIKRQAERHANLGSIMRQFPP